MVKSNDIDMGQLQDELEADEKKRGLTIARLTSARAKLMREEDTLQIINDRIKGTKAKIVYAARELTK
jgi:hypothetical protein